MAPRNRQYTLFSLSLRIAVGIIIPVLQMREVRLKKIEHLWVLGIQNRKVPFPEGRGIELYCEGHR